MMRGSAVAALVGVVMVIAGCGSSGSGEEEALQQKVHKLSGELAAVRSKEKAAVSRAEAAKTKIERSRTTILHQAEGKARKIVGGAEAKARELADVESEISSKEGELASVEESLHGAQQAKSLTSFGAGIMKAEVDYAPGATYETSGGRGCYWALLNSANTSDMAGNEFTEAATQQIVTIETPYFTSEDCGTWKEIE